MKHDQIVTPFGTAMWPYLNQPDDKFGDPVYKVDLILENDDRTGAFLERLHAMWDDAEAEARRESGSKNPQMNPKPFFPEKDEEGAETGRWVLRLKAGATFKDKRTGTVRERRLDIVDSRKRPVHEQVGGGSVLACLVAPWAYYLAGKGGLKLTLKAVQVKQLSQGGVDAFDEIEDGFETSGVASPGYDEEKQPFGAPDDGDDY